MSKRVDVCDLCEAKHPEYHFRYKAWRRFFGWDDSYREKYDICDDCWNKLREIVKFRQKEVTT